ncbi:hypothetical protein CEXT_54671 [Caerostris extrusa]|uniref:Uncharacterized protein n=1 Tax=Caerostris extrusa TaxID=172846 RepID=A0AAV4NDS6_CAEEX|nr:hypothetical protein CEXT_54671 [Caerostris extrusa]
MSHLPDLQPRSNAQKVELESSEGIVLIAASRTETICKLLLVSMMRVFRFSPIQLIISPKRIFIRRETTMTSRQFPPFIEKNRSSPKGLGETRN